MLSTVLFSVFTIESIYNQGDVRTNKLISRGSLEVADITSYPSKEVTANAVLVVDSKLPINLGDFINVQDRDYKVINDINTPKPISFRKHLRTLYLEAIKCVQK